MDTRTSRSLRVLTSDRRRRITKDAFESRLEYPFVIKGKHRRAQRRMPLDIGSIVGGTSVETAFNQSTEGYADRVTARITTWVTKRANLSQLDARDTRLFAKLSRRRVLEGFVLVNESAGKCPKSLKRLARASHQQDFDAHAG